MLLKRRLSFFRRLTMMKIYNTPLEFRRQALLPYINLGGLGLEVGAFMHPTISHLEGKVEFLDFYSTNELQAQAQKLGQDPNRVVAVNYVVRNDRYSEYVQNSFDYIIANHVFEHVSNPIAWLQMLNQML